jgi:glycosidase
MKSCFLLNSILVVFIVSLMGCGVRVTEKMQVVPSWASEVVWYQIFPGRFCNGDTTNDPTFADIQGAWPHDSILPWQVHPWGSDWYELRPYEKENGKDIWYNITRRRYGGDLQGIIDKLDYLKELGIGAIYLNPVFTAPSHHKYDQACYHHIDPTFGPDRDGDKKLVASETPDDPSTWVWTSADKLMLELIREVHKRGMRIILDGVFNHMGINSFAFQDVIKNQQKSRFKDWFVIKSWDDPVKGTTFDYEGWWGVKDMPVLRENKWGIVQGPRDYIFASVRRWMDPEGNGNTAAGIDGWRLDVASEIDHHFWRDFRKVVRSVNPEAYITGEVIEPVESIIPYLKGDQFDAVMNYNFMFIASEFFIKGRDQCPVSLFDHLLQKLREACSPGVTLVMQNLLGSHDTDRPSSRIMNTRIESFLNKVHYFNKSRATNPWYITNRPNENAYAILRLMIIFQMTYPGAPMIFYGDEAGMWGAKDPDCRKPMIWDNMVYDSARYLPNGKKNRQADPVSVNRFMLSHYKKMIAIRNTHEVLQKGNFQTVYIDDPEEIYAFSRNYNGHSAIIVLNNSGRVKNVEFSVDDDAKYIDVLNDNAPVASSERKLSLKVFPKWGMILIKQ